ncbi:MAG TPA: glycosyl hydrolase family 79 C-terminal domain-containing protein [Solirubrobacteraceae bacterium]|nr:glycosyl hydrolase family 79 C-terminal domain-containing protein [Solirubrobacteraceae bacterium]
MRRTLAASAPLVAASLALACTPCAAGAQPPPRAVSVQIDSSRPGRVVAHHFLGLSFEAAALSRIASFGERGDLVTLLRSLGPGVLRFGGVTADQNVGWTDAATPAPSWASSTIGPQDLQALGVLARRTGWSVLLTVGMAHYEPLAAAREVAAAHHALGTHLLAVEIGNEPDAYGRHGFRPLPWLAQGYDEEVGFYREAIAALTPGVPIAGPDVSGSGLFAAWGEAEALAQQPALLTGHHYPLGCASVPPPAIPTLLSANTRHRESGSLHAYMHVAKVNRIPLRIDESNSVSCGGVAGISNTFASALWAAGYIAETMAAGASGINLQGNPANCPGYTPLCASTPADLDAGRLSARPDWYGMLLTRSLVGTRPLRASLACGCSTTAPAPVPDLVAQPFIGPGRNLQIVLIDDEPPESAPLTATLHVGAGYGPARVLRMAAASPEATDGVTLGGRAVDAGGSWHPGRLEHVGTRAGVVTVPLAPSTAALVTVSPPSPPHRRTHR